LINMRGRVYDPTTATFLTPDPIVGTPSKVTGWSKYGYVHNNPLRYKDPTGFYSDGQISDPDVVIWDPTCQACDSSSTAETTQVYNDVSAGGSDDGGYIPMAVRNAPGGLEPEAYTITPNLHGPGTGDPFGLQPDFTVTPNYGVPSPPISASEQLLAGGPSGGRKGMVLERPKPVPFVGDVYTAFGDKNATDDQKWAARLEIVVNLGMMLVGPEGEAEVLAAEARGVDGLLVNGTRYINSTRVVVRAAAEPGPYHNFPAAFDRAILQHGEQKLTVGLFEKAKDGYGASGLQYSFKGSINGQQGTFEIGTRLSTSGKVELIMHRFFRPAR